MSNQPPPPPSNQPPPPGQPPPDSTASTAVPIDEAAGKPWWKKWWGIALIVFGVFVVLVAIGGGGEDVADDEEPAAEETDTVDVPDLVGMELSDARDELDDLGLEVDEVDADEDRTVMNPANWVVEAQDPEPGAELEPGDTVTLTVFRPEDREEAAEEDEPEDADEPEGADEPEEVEEPDEPEEPEIEAFDPVTLEGSGDDVIDIPTSPDHLLVAAISHDGERNFAIESHSADGDRDLLVNTIGSYSGTVPINFSFDADEFEITADGSWEVVISDFFEQPVLEDSIEGTGDQVLVVGTDANRLAITHDGERNFAVLAWGQRRDLLVNEIGAYDGTVRMGDALALEITADGNWTINAE